MQIDTYVLGRQKVITYHYQLQKISILTGVERCFNWNDNQSQMKFVNTEWNTILSLDYPGDSYVQALKNPGGKMSSKDHQKSYRGRIILTQSVAFVLEHFAYKVKFLSDISCIWVWLQHQSWWNRQHLLSYFWVVLWFMDAPGYSMARVYSEETTVNMRFTDNRIYS